MKRIMLQTFIIIVSFNLAIVGFLIAYLVTGNQVQLGILSAFASFLVSYWAVKRKLLPSNDLERVERKEKKYVLNQLRQAKEKAKTINSSRFRVRSLFVYQTITKISKISNKIIKMVEKEPVRYRTAQNFFNQHLDSSAIITEKYVQLLNQPVRTHEVSLALRETEDALKQLEKSMEKELMSVLSGDMNHLHTEIRLMNQSNLQQIKPSNKIIEKK
ncbi:5-bromo-4-chloroindolyl phosphate hydrolysis family protein [Sutcliffiella horikoshii]|uniref:5-bromo-4-chloroindolyl phosphate hydrolysis family protein n=1 Tax=Sutcliffiella horikoshii TaxID=79883 RepID=UPI0007D04DD3|nr:5-bromo-4-chloroindolyl phosphate hydrolysis family protein [Sutcliffiella horikoshii]MCM3615951.1 5-bromo-4-chloroindolyl phosphate hydrolysis family protein [Sutcliffiella horikoshii]